MWKHHLAGDVMSARLRAEPDLDGSGGRGEGPGELFKADCQPLISGRLAARDKKSSFWCGFVPRKNGYTSVAWQGPNSSWREVAGAGGEQQRPFFWGPLVNRGLLVNQGLLGDQRLLPVLSLGQPRGLPDWRRARTWVLSVHSIR